MRITEATLILAGIPLAVALLSRSFPSQRRPLILWSGLILIAGLLQIYFVGIYWQVGPAYTACLLLLAACFLRPNAPHWVARTLGTVSLLLLFSSAAFLLILPTFRLPNPTGSFAVGTTIVHIVDSGRTDEAFRSGKRELMVQVWYPTEAKAGIRAPYRRLNETTLLSSYMGVMKTHSLKDATVARRDAPFPLLLFNPAWGGQRTQNTFLVEELASHGFIVVAIDHTHNSLPISFPDGQRFDLSDRHGLINFETLPFKEQMTTFKRELDRQTADDILVLNEFLQKNATPESPWFRAIDTNRIGAMGHSFGGAVSVQTAFRDSRVRAALNLDGWNFGDISTSPLKKPVMFIYEQNAPPTAAFRVPHEPPIEKVQIDGWDAANVRRTLSEYGGIVVAIHGAKHFNFADRSLYSPVRKLTEAGPIAPERVHLIVNRYALAFFSETLKGTTEPILHETASPFPEVTIEEWTPAHP
jgi:dienelactone hydrolase